MPARFQLHLITEPQPTFAQLADAAARAADGGVTWVQLRDKRGTAERMYHEALELADRLAPTSTLLAINDRLDVALGAGAQGVHLSGQGLPVEAAVRVAAGRLVVGRSVHGLEEARAAAGEGAGYLTFGHVFPTQSKPGLPPRGLEELAEIVRSVDVPVLAIGGIHPGNVQQVLETGCAGIAVISAILSDSQPFQAASRLRKLLDDSAARPRYPFPDLEKEKSHAPHRESAAV